AFYEQHPEETLILITADHETGGIAVGNGGSRLNTKVLANQRVSQGTLSKLLSDLRASKADVSWEDVKSVLSANLGLFDQVEVTESEEQGLAALYEKSFVQHETETAKSLYANDDKLASEAVQILNKKGSVSWASGSHSAAYIPVFAIGAGAEQFTHKMENIDIPKKVAQAAGWDVYKYSHEVHRESSIVTTSKVLIVYAMDTVALR